jgi:mannan endo-1,4-beta-mannosidase
MQRSIVFIPLILIFILSCSSGKKLHDEQNPAMRLRNFLTEMSGKAILFGHQDDLAYGIGWNSISGESDVKRVAGSYPAIFGWDLGNIGDSKNLDGVPFDSIKAYIKKVHKMGGINTISWHARYPITNSDAWNLTNIDVSSLLPGGDSHWQFLKELDLVAHFLGDLKDDSGISIPIVFRPWHEMSGDWFWWGSSVCTDKEYR